MELKFYVIASKKVKQVREVHLMRKGNSEVKHVPHVDEDLLKQLEVLSQKLCNVARRARSMLLPGKEGSA